MDCRQIEASLATVADGGASGDDAEQVRRHVESCTSCRQLLQAQATARAVLRARAPQLAVTAPPGLRTSILATTRAEQAARAGILSWGGRLSAFSAAAVLFLVLGGALLPVMTSRSTVLLAAQLALDHIKCFGVDGHAHGEAISQAEAEATIKREYGWTISVPDTAAAEGLALVAVRRCLYGDGLAAHLLYRANGEPVSLFIMTGLQRPDASLAVLDHEQIVWTEGGRTFMLVARAGATDGLARMASHLRNEAK